MGHLGLLGPKEIHDLGNIEIVIAQRDIDLVQQNQPVARVADQVFRLGPGTGGGGPLTLFSLDQTTFRPAEFDGATFTFKVEAGKVTGIELKQGTNTRLLKRVESSQ